MILETVRNCNIIGGCVGAVLDASGHGCCAAGYVCN